MGLYFPGYATGGMDWMLDLGATDPTYVLPVLTAASMMVSVAFPLALVRRDYCYVGGAPGMGWNPL